MDKIERRLFVGLVLFAIGLVVLVSANHQDLFRTLNDWADPFDKTRVATVRIIMAEKDWQWLRTNARMEQYVRGDFWFDGRRYANVAVRTKGMSSLMSVADGRSVRLPLKVDFNFFNSSRSFRGLTKVSLNNGFSDPTFIREMIGYEQFEQMGIPTPRCCFVDLYVNRDHLGLYTMAEPIDKAFLRRHYSNPNGNLYKPEMGACNLNWTKADYEKQLASQPKQNTPSKQDRTAINIGGTRLSDLLRLINRENGIVESNAGQGMAGPFGAGPGGPGGGPGGPMGQGGPGGFGPGMFLAPQMFTEADTNSDQKLTKGEFSSLADAWFEKLDPNKSGKLTQEQFTEKLNDVLPPPPGFGGPGGGGGFGPAMFIGPMLFGILDVDKKGAISRTDLKSAFEKWYGQWDSDKSGNLTQEKLRDGLNHLLTTPIFGPPGGFGGFGGGPAGQGVPGPMGGAPGGFMPAGPRQNDIVEDLLLSDPGEFEERMNQQTLAARPGRSQNMAGGPQAGPMGQGGQARMGGGPGGGFGGGPGGGPGPMGMFGGGNLLDMMGLKTNENYANHQALFRFLDVLNKTPDDSFPEEIEKVLDVDQVLRYFAASVMLVHLDNYLGMGHNYYLYEDNGRFTILPWDLNMAFGTFGGSPMGGGAADFFIDEPVSGNMNDRPLVQRLLAHKPYLEKYHSYLEQMLTGCFAEGKIEARIDEIITLIRPYVEKDETKFVTMEQFESGITEGNNSGGGMGPFGGPGPQGQQVNADLPSDLPEDLAMLFSAARSAGGENRRMGFGRGGPGGGGPPGMNGPGLKSFISKRRVSVRAQLDGTKPSKLTDEQRQQQNQRWPMMGFGGMR